MGMILNCARGSSKYLRSECAEYLGEYLIKGRTLMDYVEHTSAFWLPANSENTAATLLPFASRIAPRRLPAYAPTIRPGILATMKPRPAPQREPVQVHHGATRCTSGRNSYSWQVHQQEVNEVSNNLIPLRTHRQRHYRRQVYLRVWHQLSPRRP